MTTKKQNQKKSNQNPKTNQTKPHKLMDQKRNSCWILQNVTFLIHSMLLFV